LEVLMPISNRKMMRPWLPVLLFSIIVLTGCGKGSDDQAATKGQVVARIGDEVITIPELDNELRLNNIPADQHKDPEVLKRVLGELVTRKYLVRQALNAKLDREPSVLLDLLRAREVVLANASVSRSSSAKVSAISQSQVDRYIADNPGKFANRQLISVEQIVFPMGSTGQAIVEGARQAKSLDEVDQILTAKSVPHTRTAGTLNSAELPDTLLRQIQAPTPTDVFFLRVGANGAFLVVKGKQSQPLSGDAAAAYARQALRSDVLKSDLGMASVAANLEVKYEGEYAKIMPTQGQSQSELQK
jgi:EpsD family peptidyl-prolyl cis-trans isomerase